PAGCIAAEPGLEGAAVEFVGGLRLPNDETGDCRMFTDQLAARSAALGVRFQYDTSIESLAMADGRITGVHTSAGTLTADAYVMALGSYAPLLLRPLGIRLPV